jgi:tryptophanyl-tRNA synthetase
MAKRRILTGDRPTGKLHLGHYVGSLANRVRLQDEYECFFVIADLHVLTTRVEREHVLEIQHYIREIVLDYLGVGIDPEKSVIFVHSRDARLETLPFGLLGYPVLQAADILLPRAHLVPVAKDNEAHIEVAREIARRFNRLYGEVFPEPQALLGQLLVGTDGQGKASKSLDNVIYLSDDGGTVERKVHGMYTDPRRVRADIPGQVEGNPVFIYHDAFNPDRDEVQDLKERYRRGKVGDVEVKEKLTRAINGFLDPIRERRARCAAQPGLVEDILANGTRRMRQESDETMRLVREAMGMMGLEISPDRAVHSTFPPGLIYC